MKNKKEFINNSNNAITLISLVITIVILIILASVAIYLSLGDNGLFNRAKQAKELTNKQEATDIINLKITTAQMNKYAEKQEMLTLQELADILCEDNEIQYVSLESKKVSSLEKIILGDKTSIFTKLNKYPYEFEINSSLQLASINGISVENNIEGSLNLDVLKNFKEIYSTGNARGGSYNYKLEKDYKLIIIVVSGLGESSGSEMATANIANNDVIKLINSENIGYSANKYSNKLSVAYMVNAESGTTIQTSFSYYGYTHIYALGEE